MCESKLTGGNAVPGNHVGGWGVPSRLSMPVGTSRCKSAFWQTGGLVGGEGGGVRFRKLWLTAGECEITSQRLLDQSQAGVYRGKCHIPPHFGLFGPIRVPYPKGLNC